MSEALVVSASREDVLAWVARHPTVSAHVLQQMARRISRKSRAARDLPVADGPGRVARAVLTLADKHTVDGVVQHGLTQRSSPRSWGSVGRRRTSR
jgi:CRP-like cAMP-binding protein